MVAFFAGCLCGALALALFVAGSEALDSSKRRKLERQVADAERDRDAWKASSEKWQRVAEAQWDTIDGYERKHEETAQLLATLREQASGESAEMAVVA